MSLQFKRLVKSNLDLAKWVQIAHVPSFEDYMEVGEVEITMYATMAGTLMGMGYIATKETYEWLKSRPKLIQSLSINGRLMNDIAGFEVRGNDSFRKCEVKWVKFVYCKGNRK